MRDKQLRAYPSIVKPTHKKQKTETTKEYAFLTRERFRATFSTTFLPSLPRNPTNSVMKKQETAEGSKTKKDDLDSVLAMFEQLDIKQKTPNEYRLERNTFTAEIERFKRELRLKSGQHEDLYSLTEIPVQREKIQALTEAENEIVDKLMRPGQVGSISQFKTAEVEYKDIYKLSPGTWLNDEIINFHFELLSDRASKDDTLPSIHCFNTFFCSTLREQGYAKVKRWTKRVDIFSKDLVFVPINKSYHWVLGVIDMKNKKISIYDSLYGKDQRTLDILLRYLEEEHLDKKKTEYDTSDWKTEAPNNIPKQENAYDCGVFTCIFAERLSRQAPLDFVQADMSLLRRKMVINILNKEIA